MKKSLLLVSIFTLIASCIFLPQENIDTLISYWIEPEYNDSLITYCRATSMPNDAYGFAFKENGVFKEHKNAGSCGTPPISYANYEGTWTLKDSVIKIEVPYWGGTANYTWKLININDSLLTIQRVDN